MNEQETLEKAAENYGWRIKRNTFSDVVKVNELANSAKQDFIEGANWQKQNMFSEEELYILMNEYAESVMGGCNLKARQWFEHKKEI